MDDQPAPQDTPSRHQDKYTVRFPGNVRADLKAAAKANKRTLNAEIVARCDVVAAPQGIGLRDWFAGQALGHATREIWSEHKPEDVAKRAYLYADAMLAARGDSEAPQDG